MIIYDKAGSVLLDIEVDDTSVRYKAIKGENSLTLKFSLAEHIEVPLGAYCLFKGELYSLMLPEDLTMNHRRSFEYTLVMYSEDAKSKRIVFINPVDGRVKFPLTAKPVEHLQMFVDNMNMRDAGWSIGECPDHVEITLSYNSTKCHDALVQLADELELDYWFNGKVVNIGKLELNKDNPLPLSYGGDGEGLKPNVKRTNYSDALPIEVLYVQGTETNIDASKYGASELHLPKGKTIKFDGTFFEDEEGFDESKARSYKTDEKGYSVTRADKEIANHSEDSLDCSDIEPTKEEVVSSVIEVNKEKHFYDILFASDVDYSQYVIGGENATVVFQSGMLAGKEFDLATDENGNLVCKKDGDFWRIEIVPQDIDGITMPDKESGFLPTKGNTFKVFGIQLPDEYMRDAEMNMLRYAVKHFYANEDVQYTVSGELDEIYAKRNWDSIKDRLALGSYISFSDKSFQEEPLLIRITGIKDYVNKPYSPQLEISNAALSGTLVSALNRIENQEVETEDKIRQAIGFSRRRWRDAKETISMLNGALSNYTESISPITVETMSMLVGDERLQFVFTDSLTSNSIADLNFSYDSSTGIFSVQSAFIKHMTLGIDSISPVHTDDEYKRWSVTEKSETLDPNKGYYLYAVVSKESAVGAFELSDIVRQDTDEWYYLLVGILNSEYNGERSFASMYGYTEVRPGQITTDNIRSSDGKTWLDLLRGILHLNDRAGVSGVQDENKKEKSIAAWFGGLMQDAEIEDDAADPAAAVIRHDGTGYFAKGNFSWDKEGGAKFGGGDLKILPDGSVEFGRNIKITSDGDETLGTILTLLANISDWFTLEDGVLLTKYNLASEKEVSALGINASQGGGTSYNRLDSWSAYDSSKAGYVLSALLGYDLHTRLISVENRTVDLSGYYTKSQTDVKISSAIAGIDLTPYATTAALDKAITDLNISQYAKSADVASTYATIAALSILQGQHDILRGEFDALNNLLSSDTTDYINTWNEVVAFLDGYKDESDLATILSGMNADISSRLLTSTFDSWKADTYTPLANLVANHTTKLDSIDASITNINTRLEGVDKTIEDHIAEFIAFRANFEISDDLILVRKNFASTEEVSAKGINQGTGGGGGNSYSRLDTWEGYDNNKAGYVLSAGLGYGLKVTIDELEGYDLNNRVSTIENSYVSKDAGGVVNGGLVVSSLAIAGGTSSQFLKADGSLDSISYLSTAGGNLYGNLVINGALAVTSNITFYESLTMKSEAGINFYDADNFLRGILLPSSENNYALSWYDTTAWRTIWHSGNFNPSDYLPTSGGTINGYFGAFSVKRYEPYASAIKFENSVGILGYIGINDDYTPLIWDKDLNTRTILHSGNIGEYAGIYLSSATIDLNEIRYGFRAGKLYNSSNAANAPAAYRGFLEYGTAGFVAQFNSDDQNNLFYRWCENGTWLPWKTIAFTDSNVASAQALMNQYGGIGATVDSNSSVNFYGNKIYWHSDPNNYYIDFHYDGTNTPRAEIAGYGGIRLCTVGTQRMLINPSGSVTIGASDLAGEDVNLYVDGHMATSNNKALYGKDTSGILRQLLVLNNWNDFVLGYGASSAGFNTYIDGSKIYLRYGTGHSTGLILNSSGNVTIGSSDLAGTSARLYVDGRIYAETGFFFNGDYGIWKANKQTAAAGDSDILYYAPRHFLVGGNVLIGTTEDNGAKLQVNGQGYFTSHLYTKNWAYYRSYKADGTPITLLGITGDNTVLLNDGDSSVKTIIGGGNVGIGGITPQQPLHVNGVARVQRRGIESSYLDITVGDVVVTYNGYDSDGFCSHSFRSNDTDLLYLNGHSNDATFYGSLSVNSTLSVANTISSADSITTLGGHVSAHNGFRINNQNKFSGLYPNSLVTLGGNATDVWMYVEAGKAIILGESGIDLRAATEITSTLTVSGLSTLTGGIATNDIHGNGQSLYLGNASNNAYIKVREDMQGSSSMWSIPRDGRATFTSLTTPTLSVTGSATIASVTIDAGNATLSNLTVNTVATLKQLVVGIDGMSCNAPATFNDFIYGSSITPRTDNYYVLGNNNYKWYAVTAYNVNVHDAITIEAGKELRFKDDDGVVHTLKYDSTKQAFVFDGNVNATGEMSAKKLNA